MNKVLLVVTFMMGLLGCGVRGDPVPPQRPVEIGRGKPSFKRATEKIKVEDRFKEDPKEVDSEKEEDER